jgi:hypothetical protein
MLKERQAGTGERERFRTGGALSSESDCLLSDSVPNSSNSSWHNFRVLGQEETVDLVHEIYHAFEPFGIPEVHPARKSLGQPLRLQIPFSAGRPFRTARNLYSFARWDAFTSGLAYAMFTWGSIGIFDRESLLNVTGESWVRFSTTIVKHLQA